MVGRGWNGASLQAALSGARQRPSTSWRQLLGSVRVYRAAWWPRVETASPEAGDADPGRRVADAHLREGLEAKPGHIHAGFAAAYAPIVQRAAAIIGSAIFLVIAPGTLAVYVPWYLTHWHFAPALFQIARVLGAALIVAGLPILLDSFARFALQGLGTPAPVMPPKRLVVTGFYRYVRNPIYVAVTALIAGQGLLFGSVTGLEYGAIVWARFFLFVVAYEEPALGEQFADEYKRYRANVRRWLPRITPWRG